jgi:hypothetical protein
MTRSRAPIADVNVHFPLPREDRGMTLNKMPQPDDGFVRPGAVSVSAPALKLAQEFYRTVKGVQGKDWIVAFDWAASIAIRSGPNEPSQDIDACLTLGAYERDQIPKGFIDTIDGTEIAIRIPAEVRQRAVQHLIDVDETLLFKLLLR